MKPISAGRRAAEMYLEGRADGSLLSLKVCAERYGITVGGVERAVKLLRRERRLAAEGAPTW